MPVTSASTFLNHRVNYLLILLLLSYEFTKDMSHSGARDFPPEDDELSAEKEPSKAPCGACDLTVGWSAMAVECETCGMWYHAACQNIGPSSYADLDNTEVSWHCIRCCAPNYSKTVFDLFGIEEELTNDFSKLSVSSDPNKFKPLHCSTPTRASQQDKYRTRPIRILNINFQSVVGKKAPLANVLESVKPDIVIGTETWLQTGIQNAEFLPDNYRAVGKHRKDKGGGGVFIAYRDDIQCTEMPELDTDCDIIWAKVMTPGRKALFICAYYRPDVSDENSLKQFEASLKKTKKFDNSQVIIAGDLNFRGFDWITDTDHVIIKNKCPYPKLHQHFLDLLADYGLEQMVHEPTRLENTLDIVLTNRPDLIPRVETIPPLSDHQIVYFEFSTKLCRKKNAPRDIPLYDKANWDAIREDLALLVPTLENTEQENKKQTSSVEEMWQLFKTSLHESIRKNIPHKTTKKKSSSPWVTEDIRRLIRKRDRKYKQMKKQGTEQLKSEVKELHREIQQKLRQSYWGYMGRLFTDSSDQEAGEAPKPYLKRFWSYIKHQRTSNTGIPPLKVQGKLVIDPKLKAEELNAQFNHAFSDGKQYTADEFRKKCTMHDRQEDYPSMNSFSVSDLGVEKLLKNLNPHKAPGPDGISPRVLKELAPEIAPILAAIYRRSLDTGEVPSDWREATVTPVYKKGEHYNPANYRPVSLTSVPCKVLEHIIVSHLMQHLEENKILSDRQHGFRKHRSCETQLLEFMDELTARMEMGQQTDVVVMDFAKAFDKVNHSLLLHKLHHYGIRGTVNRWLSGFLTNRRQAVVVEGVKSDYIPVRSGVPQGSVVGPVMFLVYINDLAERVESLTRLFADDTILYRFIETADDHLILQADLKKLEEWEAEWDMRFHPDKCNVLTISRKQNSKAHQYMLHDHVLASVKSTKYLGVTLQHDTKFAKHIDTVTAKANRSLGFLRRNLRIRSPDIKALAYKTLVRPILEYSSTVWDPVAQRDIDKLEAVQRRAARFALNQFQKTACVTKMLQQLKWPSLEDRRKTARLGMLYKISNSLAAVQCPHLRRQPQRTRRTHDQTFERIPCRADYRLNSFFPRTIRDWNILPSETVSAPSLGAFISRVSKMHS